MIREIRDLRPAIFHRVRVQLTLLTVAIVLLLYVISSIGIFLIVRRIELDAIDDGLSHLVQRVEQEGYPNVAFTVSANNYVMALGPKGIVYNLPPSLEAEVRPMVERHQHDGQFAASFRGHDGVEYRLVLQSFAKHNQSTTAAVAVTSIDREATILDQLRAVLLLVGVGGGVIALFAGFYLAERALRPVRLAWQRQLEFVSNASHELRTPLAVIQSNLGIAMEHTDETIVQNLEWIGNAFSESRRLTRLVENLLTLARSDSDAVHIVQQPVDLKGLVLRVAELFESLAETQEIKLTYGMMNIREESVVVLGDPDRLHQMLVILLDNACKFTQPGGSIEVRLTSQRSTVGVTVTDTGIGILENELPHVFDRFYRTDRARARTGDGGAGLGLSLAKWIVEAHHGKIQIQSKIGEGTAVTVVLPRSTSLPKPQPTNE